MGMSWRWWMNGGGGGADAASTAIEDGVDLISLESAPTSARDAEADPFASLGDVTLETASAVVDKQSVDDDEFGDFAGSGEGGMETATPEVDEDEFGDFV